jgi:hypothetical protein
LRLIEGVEYMADERNAESLEGYYLQFTGDQLARIKAVAMDMWEPNFKATLKHVPDAADKIVHDRFHYNARERGGGSGTQADLWGRKTTGSSGSNTSGCTGKRTCRISIGHPWKP